MASIQKKGNAWYCQFLYRRQRHTFAVGEVAEDEARAVAAKVGYLLMRLKQNLLELPTGCDIVTFVRFDGNASSRSEKASHALGSDKAKSQEPVGQEDDGQAPRVGSTEMVSLDDYERFPVLSGIAQAKTNQAASPTLLRTSTGSTAPYPLHIPSGRLSTQRETSGQIHG
jgi:hypothetical protein